MSEDNLEKMFDEEQDGTDEVDEAPSDQPDPREENVDKELIPASPKSPEVPSEEPQLKFPFVDEPLNSSLPTQIERGSKTIMINFDGVIHDTNRPWEKREEINGPIVEGVFKAMRKYHEYGFHLHVCSSRAGSQAGITAIFNYMRDKGIFKKVLHQLSISDKVVPYIVFIGDTEFSIDDSFPSINTIMMKHLSEDSTK